MDNSHSFEEGEALPLSLIDVESTYIEAGDEFKAPFGTYYIDSESLN